MREITDPDLLARLESGELPQHPMAAYGNAVRHVESRGNPNAVSRAGAVGADQFMPATAKAMGLSDPRDPVMSAVARDLLLAENYSRFKDPTKALQAYNVGPGAVASGRPLPKETQEYAPKVLAAMGQQSDRTEITDPELIARLEGMGKPKQKESLPQAKAAATGKSLTHQAAEATLEEMPWYEKALVGSGKAVADLGRTLGLMPEGDKDIDAALLDTGAGMVGNIAGEIGMTAIPGTAAFKAATNATRLSNAVKLAPRITKNMVGGAAAGATSEAMMNRDPVTGATYGAALGPVFMGMGKAGNELLKEVQRIRGGATGRAVEDMRKVFGPRTQAAISALRNTRPIVPGEQVTAGQAATSALPELSVLEAGARSRPQAHLFEQADEATAKARTAVLDDIETPAGVRGTDPATGRSLPSGFESARAQTTGPYYDSAMPNLVSIPRDLQAAFQGSGTVGSVVNNANRDFIEAVRLARAEGRPPPPGGRAMPGQPYNQMSVDQLQRVLRELDSIPFAQRDYNVTNARRQISQLMRRESPDYATGTDLFREMSMPQNRADVAAVLRKTMNSPSNELNQRAGLFSEALRNAPTTIKKTGISQPFQKIEEVFAPTMMEPTVGPQQLQNIRNLEQSLQRESRVAGLPKEKGIVPKYMSAFDLAAQNTPNFMTRVFTAAKSIAKTAGKRTDEEVQKVIDRAMADPQAMANLLEQLPPTERNAFLNAMRQQSAEIPSKIIAPATGILEKTE